jgi:hypothetical protein
MTTFWLTFPYDGKLCPAWWRWGGARPPPVTPSTITIIVVVDAPAERADRYTPPISPLPLSPLWAEVKYSCIKGLKFKKPSLTIRLATPNLLTWQEGGGLFCTQYFFICDTPVASYFLFPLSTSCNTYVYAPRRFPALDKDFVLRGASTFLFILYICLLLSLDQSEVIGLVFLTICQFFCACEFRYAGSHTMITIWPAFIFLNIVWRANLFDLTENDSSWQRKFR